MRKKASAKSSIWAASVAPPRHSRASHPSAPSVGGGSAVPGKPELGLGDGLLVVMELGAEWPTSLVTASAAATARRVLTQAEGEAPSAFAERVGSSLDSLFDRRVPLGTVMLACNERVDETAESARRRTLSVALGLMALPSARAQQPRGQVYLAAPARSSGRLRHALSSLAQGLFDEWRTADLEVSVDFAEERADADAKPFAFTARVA